MTKSHDRFPIASPLIPMSVMISRVASNSIVLPLWRRLETTGYFTRPPSSPLASIAQCFTLSSKSREFSGSCQAGAMCLKALMAPSGCAGTRHRTAIKEPGPAVTPGRVGESARYVQCLCGLYVFILLEDPDGRMFSENGV